MAAVGPETQIHRPSLMQDEKAAAAAHPDEHGEEYEDWEIIDEGEGDEVGRDSLPCCYVTARLRLGEASWRYIRANCTHWTTSNDSQEERGGLDSTPVSSRSPSQFTVEISAASGSEALLTLGKLGADKNIQSLRIRRPVSVRYIDVRGWRVLLKLLTAELEKFPQLRSLEIVTPAVEGLLSPAEEERKQEMGRIDAALRAAVISRS